MTRLISGRYAKPYSQGAEAMLFLLFTARRYPSAVYTVVVCPSDRPSQAGIVSNTTGRIELVFGMETFLHLSHSVL